MGMATDNTKIENGVQEEQKNTTMHTIGYEAKSVINKLNENAKAIIAEQEVISKKKFIFNKDTSTKYDLDLFLMAETYRQQIEEYGYNVVLEENLEKKDVTKESKYMVRISDKNGCFVEFSYFEYRAVMLDFEESERDYIYKYLIKMAGSNQVDLKNIADLICDYLAILCHFKEFQVKVYDKIGWDQYDGETIFKYDVVYNKASIAYNLSEEGIDQNKEVILNQMLQIRSRCVNEIADSLHCGDSENIEEWINDFTEYLTYSPKSALIISAAATGLVRQLLPYTKENNINMNIVGKPAHGKSIICHFALSLFGDPRELEGSFVDSDVAMELNRVKRPVIPYVLDERMLKIEDSSDKAKRQKVLMDIFKEYEGKAKEKTAGKGVELSGERTYSPIISTSVERMLDVILDTGRDLGQYRRFIEIELEKKSDLFKDAEMADKAENLAYTKYGYGIELLVPHILWKMQGNENYVVDLYNEYVDIITKSLKEEEIKHNMKGFESSARRFALIITTLHIIKDAINEFESPEVIGKVDSQLIVDVYNLLTQNLVNKMKEVENSTINDAFESSIRKFIKRNIGTGLFREGETSKWDGYGGFLGNLVDDGGDYYELQVSVDRGHEWVVVYGDDLSIESLKEYTQNTCRIKNRTLTLANYIEEYKKLGIETHKVISGGEFTNFAVKTKKLTNITVEEIVGAGKVKLFSIKIKKQNADPTKLKDSDNKKED